MEHWRVVDVNPLNMAVLESPTMKADPDGGKIFTSFSSKRQLYVQFKKMEQSLKRLGMRGWIGSTEVGHAVVIRMIAKCGGQPYWVDLKHDLIWFMKDFSKEET